MRHEKAYNEIARERYQNVMYFYINRNAQLREAGFVIQPHLPWVFATPDGLFVFRGIILMQIYFKKDVFVELIHIINSCYKEFSLPKLAMDFGMEKRITKV